MKFVALFAIATATFGLSSSGVKAAPPQLYNKSIVVSWGESGTYKRISDGTQRSETGQFQIAVYVSGAGRAFFRYLSRSGSGRFGRTSERGPETNSGNVQFNGNGFVAFYQRSEVVRRIAATFDQSFAGCTAAVTIGKLNRDATIPGFDNAGYRVLSMQPGAASCSIREGNVFGN